VTERTRRGTGNRITYPRTGTYIHFSARQHVHRFISRAILLGSANVHSNLHECSGYLDRQVPSPICRSGVSNVTAPCLRPHRAIVGCRRWQWRVVEDTELDPEYETWISKLAVKDLSDGIYEIIKAAHKVSKSSTRAQEVVLL
jgi:hypothetical protein